MYSNSNFEFSQVAGPRGLQNLGNTCYINAVLQGLQGCHKFRELFLTKSYSSEMSKAMSTVVSSLNVDDAEAYDPSPFMEALTNCWDSFAINTQMDAEEFWLFLLGALHEELKTEVNPPDFIDSQDNAAVEEIVVNRWRSVPSRSPIGLLFHIQTVTYVYCPCCNYLHGQYDDINNHLSVPVADTIEESFKKFAKETDLKDGKCNSCGSLGLKHQLLLGRLPPLLMVHLKRFDDSLNKISSIVEVSGTLDVKPFTVQGLQSSLTYKLLGVTRHHGPSVRSGHYTTVISRGDRLYNFDDSRVSNTTARKLSCSTSYLLWYELLEGDGELPLDRERRSLLESEIYPSTPDSQQPCSHDTSLTGSDSTISMVGEVFNDVDDGETSIFFFEENNHYSSSEDLFAENDASISHDISLSIQGINITENDSPHGNSVNLEESNTEPQSLTTCNRGDFDFLDPHFFEEEEPEEPPSPPGCSHRSFDLDVIDPQLFEGEVPGAKIIMADLENCKRDVLERWLLCRRLRKSGTRPTLIQRIRNHHKKGKSHRIFPGIDGGKWYELKRKKLMEQADSPSQRLPMMPLGVSIYKPFPSTHIPNGYSAEKVLDYLQKIPITRFTYENGVQSVVREPDEEGLLDFSQPSQEDRRNIFVNGTLKRATQFFDSGRVLYVTDCERGDHYFVKADVHASYHNVTYKTSIMISKKSGSVCFAECCCKAKALGRCCHIIAVLLLISHHVQNEGHEAVTCTGRTCYWLARGSTAHRQPEVVREQSQYYVKTKYHRRGHYDPRPTANQIDTDDDLVRNFHQKLSEERLKCLWYFQLLQPTQLLQPPDIVTTEYPDIQLTQNLAEQCSYLMWNLNNIRAHSTTGPLHLFLTKEQYLSAFWFSERSVRMPASKAKTILGLRTGMLKFMRKHMWGLEPYQNDAMKRGIALEPLAREHYKTELKKVSPLSDVLESGVWVNPLYPQLSCSPDGLLTDTNGICKLLEIKCPAVLEEMDPNDWENLPSAQRGRFCLYRCKDTGKVKLKPTDRWYYQVQMSMDIMKVSTCDFVIFSTIKDKDSGKDMPKSLKIPVDYDESFWKEKRERLIRIHREWFVPEHFLQNTVFGRQPQHLIYSPYHEAWDDLYFGNAAELKKHLSVQNESEFLIDNEETPEESQDTFTVNIKSEHEIIDCDLLDF